MKHRYAILGCFLALAIGSAPALAIDGCPVPLYFWGGYGSSPGQMNFPSQVSIGTDGYLYTTDQHNERVQVFADDGSLITTWAIPPGANGYAYPTGICVSNGVVWVSSNQGQHVTRWTTGGTFLGYAPTPPGGWVYPTDIAADAAGNVYVCNSVVGEIVKIDPAGTQVLGRWYTGGTPYGIDVDRFGRVLVGDYSLSRVTLWTTSGASLGTWGGPGQGDGFFYAAEGISHDAAGNIFVCDTGNRRVQKFKSDGTFVCAFGSEGSDLGQLYVPSDIAVAPSGDMFVVEFGNHRIQRFTFGVVAAKTRTWGSIKTLYR